MLDEISGWTEGPLGVKGPVFSWKDPTTYQDIIQQGSSIGEIVEGIFKSKELEKETEMIELVRKLVLERVEELLDGKIDDIVKILVENKLFEDENIGLKKQLEELNLKISRLEGIVDFLNAQALNQQYRTYYGYGTTGTGTGDIVRNTGVTTISGSPIGIDSSGNCISLENTAQNSPKAL